MQGRWSRQYISPGNASMRALHCGACVLLLHAVSGHVVFARQHLNDHHCGTTAQAGSSIPLPPCSRSFLKWPGGWAGKKMKRKANFTRRYYCCSLLWVLGWTLSLSCSSTFSRLLLPSAPAPEPPSPCRTASHLAIYSSFSSFSLSSCPISSFSDSFVYPCALLCRFLLVSLYGYHYPYSNSCARPSTIYACLFPLSHSFIHSFLQGAPGLHSHNLLYMRWSFLPLFLRKKMAARSSTHS